MLVAAVVVSLHADANEPTRLHRPPLLVVSGEVDVQCVRRLAASVAEARSLLPCHEPRREPDYERCHEHVLELRSYHVLLRSREVSPVEMLWAERLSVTNPRGRVITIDARCAAGPRGLAHGVDLAQAIHAALSALLPEHRARLDANLDAELERLRINPSEPALWLAAGEPRQEN